MFSDRFQADRVVEEESKTIKSIVCFVYPVFFHSISSHIKLDMRKVWAFLSIGWLGFLSRGSLWKKKDKSLEP